MRPDWREIPRGDVRGQWVGLYISMNPKGGIAMSRYTHEKLGAPKAFVLLFDATNNRIGLKPASLTARNAYPAYPQGLYGGRIVRAYRLMREHDIRLAQTLQFDDAEINDEGILVLDLRTARVSTRAANHPRNRGKQVSTRNGGDGGSLPAS